VVARVKPRATQQRPEPPGDAVPQLEPGRYDPARRRRTIRRGRERGCWLYVAAEELLRAGIDPYGPAPFYRVWGSRRGSVVVRLYREG
jgi:hypothetical protein